MRQRRAATTQAEIARAIRAAISVGQVVESLEIDPSSGATRLKLALGSSSEASPLGYFNWDTMIAKEEHAAQKRH